MGFSQEVSGRIRQQRSGLSKNFPGENLEHLPVALCLPEPSVNRTLAHKMFELQANTVSRRSPWCCFPSGQTDCQSLDARFFCVALTHLLLCGLQLSLDSCPAGKAWAVLQTWRVETGGPLSENGTGSVRSQQMGAGARRREGPITISYIQRMLSILLTTQTYKG